MSEVVFERSVFVFKDNDLVFPEGIPDSAIHHGVKEEELPGNVKSGGRFEFPALEFSEEEGGPRPRILCYTLEGDEPLPPGWRIVPIRAAIPRLSLLNSGNDGAAGIADPGDEARYGAGRLFRAFHILQWRRNSRFCGSCGNPNGDAPDELARLCPVCGRMEFPRISPAVIVTITNDRDEILLAHNSHFAGNVYSLIAGFNEAGENLEATVSREIREEVGVRVRDIKYLASQPWPFPASLMIGFSARHAGGEIVPDGIEISDARWFSRDNLPDLPGVGSIARFLINRWMAS